MFLLGLHPCLISSRIYCLNIAVIFPSVINIMVCRFLSWSDITMMKGQGLYGLYLDIT